MKKTFDEIMRDIERDKSADNIKERMQAHVDELMDISPDVDCLRKLYETIYDLIVKYNLDKTPILNYIDFLNDNNESITALSIAQDLKNEFVNIPSFYISLGGVYSKLFEYDNAEYAYNQALQIYMRLAESNPQVHEPKLATIYYKLGLTCQAQNKDFEHYFDKAYEIAKQHLNDFMCQLICDLYTE